MERDGKMRDIAYDHYLYPLLHDMPNEWMTASEFWGMVMLHVSHRGNFYAIKNRSRSTNKILELIPLPPGIVTEVVQNLDYTLTYKCSFPDGRAFDIPGTEMMHIKGMTLNGYVGVNPIEYVRESIGLGLATEEFGARYFGSGTHPGMVLEHPGKISEVAHKNLASSLDEAYSGLGKAHRMMLLEEGMKATAITISPEDSQFLDTRRYQKSEIVDIFFGQPLTLMGSGDNTPTFASAEQFSIGFVVYALMPWIVNIEKAIYRDLLSPEERKRYYAKFKVESLQRGSFKDQMDGYATAITKEIFSPNEIRAMMDVNPYPGGDTYAPRTNTTAGDATK